MDSTTTSTTTRTISRRPVTATQMVNGNGNANNGYNKLNGGQDDRDNDDNGGDGDDDDRDYDNEVVLKWAFESTTAAASAGGNKSNTLDSRDQLTKALQQAGLNPSRRSLNDHWKDGGPNETITFDRFRDIAKRLQRKPKNGTPSDVYDYDYDGTAALLKAFRKFDPEKTGKIAQNHLRLLMTTKGERMTDDEFSRIFNKCANVADNDGDGDNFDYFEFCNAVKRTVEKCREVALDAARNGSGKHPKNRTKKKQRPMSCQARFSMNDSPNGIVAIRTKSGTRSGTDIYTAPTKEPIWPRWQSRGNFHVDDGDHIVSHQYGLEIASSSEVFLTIEPVLPARCRPDRPVDCLIYVLKEGESGGGGGRQLASFTENRDDNGLYFSGMHLDAGRYTLQPFTSGCFLCRGHQPEVDTEQTSVVGKALTVQSLDGGLRLTDDYRMVLKEIFHVVDLDGNGCLNRQEFSLFQWQSCGEEVQDDEWNALGENFEMENGELTLKGFLDVHQLEAENHEGVSGDLWKTLHAMGYDNELNLTRMLPFQVTVYAAEAQAKLRVSAVKAGGSTLEKAVLRSLIETGDVKKVRNLNDLLLYSYIVPYRAILAVQNKSHSSVSLRLDCSGSQNCYSHRGTLDYVLHVPPKSMKVGHYLLPLPNNVPWKVVCNESVVQSHAT